MKNFALGLFALILASAAPALAGTIPYPNPGTIAPQVTTYATSSGGIDIYYYGSTASFTDYVQVYDVQTGFLSNSILDNHATAPGTEVAVGTGAGQINAGDQLIFYINSPEGNFASIASYSADGVNHAYITSYAGGVLDGVTIPAGVFVGMEDLINGQSDFNYNDDTFVFTGVSAPSIGVGVTPEPSTVLLLGTGLAGLAGGVRKKFARSK